MQIKYRDEIYSLQNLLSRTQAGPGRAVKKEQEEISPNHVQRINLISVPEEEEIMTGSYGALKDRSKSGIDHDRVAIA